jgi:O-methyltransferase
LLDDDQVGRCVDIAQPFCKAPRARLLAMAAQLRRLDAAGIAGDVVECGVWRGGHTILARLLSPDRVNWLYDTFDGMAAPGAADGPKACEKYQRKAAAGVKWNAVHVTEVFNNLVVAGALPYGDWWRDLHFVIGDVCDTLKNPKALPQRIALLRLDTDFYESTRVELAILYPRLCAGGALIIDDYGHWPGCRRAVDEYFGRAGVLTMLDYTCGLLIKPA